ncbi:MAG: RidA family protein [Spirochaetales bacterium]|nr:RidA family protein [Spirochaetales bacterium]
MKHAVHTDKAPAAVGPYSQGITWESLVFTSGQLGIDPATGSFAGADTESQAVQVFENLKAVLEAAGSGLDKVIKVTVFLADMADFKKVNEVYARYFSKPFPARSAVQVAALPLGGRIEAEAVACKG